MKKWNTIGILAILIMGMVLMTGCTSSQSTATSPITTAPTVVITTLASPVQTAAPDPGTTIIPTMSPRTKITTIHATPVAKADPTDVSQIQFTQYTDSDFSMDYPSTWNVSKTNYTSYYCKSTETIVCYQNELRTIGPFYFGEMDGVKKPTRIVTFTSADGKQKIVAFISDFFDNANRNFGIDPNIQWVKNRVTDNYRGATVSAVADYQYDRSGNSKTISYSVTMPVGSDAYPLAYKIKDFFTLHHNYEFAFISDNKNIQKYRNLGERILSSITPNDIS